ncbi:hypothetical protein AB5N19_12065 [Seiridium cardinale]
MSPGALTATFAPPASCLSALSHTSLNGTVYYTGPAATESYFLDNYQPPRSNYCSPGVCHYGYRSACSFISGVDTVVTCCPGTLTCNTVTGMWASTLGCNFGWASPDIQTISLLKIIHGKSSVLATRTVEPCDTTNAYSVRIRFQTTNFKGTSNTVNI